MEGFARRGTRQYMTAADSEPVTAGGIEPPSHDFLESGFIGSFNRRYPTHIIETLLCDRTTGRNIIWADNEYEALGDGYMGDDEITVEKITGTNSGVIKPRIAKEQERQSQRTKSRAEVFTPSWLCNQMNNDLDEVWFGRRDVFNVEDVAEDGTKTWAAAAEPITFPKTKGHGWHAYVEAPRLEITCGEAPFVCSRYDTVTGEELPVRERVGFLDRKLRVVTEKTKTRKEWMRHALDALRATYGFEYQGDNLLIARINVFETFAEHLRERWGPDTTREELEQAAWIVSWNFWQMNGFTDAVPTNKMGAEVESTLGTFETPKPEPVQQSLFDLFDDAFPDEMAEEAKEEEPKETVPLCVIYDWRNGEPFEFATLKGKATDMEKKFYAVIGNPPYQLSVAESDSGNKTYAPPIYHEFMDSAFEVSDKVELITPARFLFDAGSTPKIWNSKMLNDTHFKVLRYEENASNIFSNTDIKGGVVVTYRDTAASFGGIKVFTKHDALNRILGKVCRYTCFQGMEQIVISRTAYRLTERVHNDYPFARYSEDENGDNMGRLSKGHDYDMATNIFDCLPEIFFDELPTDDEKYIRILGREASARTFKFIKAEYVNNPKPLNAWSIVLPKANGTGQFGEVLSQPIVTAPGTGSTESFLSVGFFETEVEARNCLKFISTKFARAMLGILKITQDLTPKKWAYVPLQDFTPNSDIDWSQSVADIDRQLYAKYGLDDDEIAFIESHVKEMD